MYTCNHTVTQAELDAGGNLTNTVTADSNETPPDTDTLNIPVTKPPVVVPPVVTPRADISVTKAATAAVELPLGGGTAPITYTLVVSNAGPTQRRT